MKRINAEEALCLELADYLRLAHPSALYHFDFGSGTKLSMKQAVTQKRLNQRAWPDLLIAEPRHLAGRVAYHGMFIELKRAGTRLKKRDRTWATPHIAEQAAVLEALQDRGYIAQFACGIDAAIEVIDSYLRGGDAIEVAA